MGGRGVLGLEGGKRRDGVREKGESFRGQHESSYHESTGLLSTNFGNRKVDWGLGSDDRERMGTPRV